MFTAVWPVISMLRRPATAYSLAIAVSLGVWKVSAWRVESAQGKAEVARQQLEVALERYHNTSQKLRAAEQANATLSEAVARQNDRVEALLARAQAESERAAAAVEQLQHVALARRRNLQAVEPGYAPLNQAIREMFDGD